MGGEEEDKDDVAREIASEHIEREEREYRFAHPHCTCQAELTWDEERRSWVCNTPTCPHNQFGEPDENVLRCDTCTSHIDVRVINSGPSSWDHVRTLTCHSCLVDKYGFLVKVEESRVEYRSRELRGLPPIDDEDASSED